jgi:amino acid transporter
MMPTGIIDQEKRTLVYKPSNLDIWALGITIVIGGQYFCWNAGLNAGICSNAIALILMGSAYLCLTLCMSEMSSVLPFAGGAYGLGRCSLGFYIGFIIGCCETLEYIAYVSVSVVSLSDLIYEIHPETSRIFEPLIWLGIYALANIIQIHGTGCFWRFNMAIAWISLLLVVIYVIGSIQFMDFTRYSNDVRNSSSIYFIGGFPNFMKNLPTAAWFFVGIESLNTLCNVVTEPKRIIPGGQVPCILTLILSAIGVFTVTVGSATDINEMVNRTAVMSPGKCSTYFLTFPH